jgi:hypothetical protein
VAGKDNNVRKVYKPLKQYPGDVEGTIDPMRIIVFTFSFFLILPFLHFTLYSLD